MSGLHVICNQGKGAIRTSAGGVSLQNIPLQFLACQARYQHACNARNLEEGMSVCPANAVASIRASGTCVAGLRSRWRRRWRIWA